MGGWACWLVLLLRLVIVVPLVCLAAFNFRADVAVAAVTMQ